MDASCESCEGYTVCVCVCAWVGNCDVLLGLGDIGVFAVFGGSDNSFRSNFRLALDGEGVEVE